MKLAEPIDDTPKLSIVAWLDERIEVLREELKEIGNQHCTAFHMVYGALDELKYAREQILEIING